MARVLLLVFAASMLSCGGDSPAPTELALPVTPSAAMVCATFTPLARTVAITNPSVDAWLNLFARVIPGGYAGYDAFGTKPAMLLVDTTKFAAAKENTTAVMNCDGFPPQMGFALPTESVKSARFDFSRLYAWDAALASALGKATGVRTREFDLAANQILVSVIDATAASEVRGAARRAGIPDAAVATRVLAR